MRFALLAALLFVLAPVSAEARCASRFAHAWPADGARIAPSGLVLVHGGGVLQKVVLALDDVALVSGQERVPLLRLEAHAGFRQTQVALRPERPLTPGHTYRLTVGDDALASTLGAVRYTVVARDETRAAPRWVSTPELVRSRYVSYGCGPARYADVVVLAEGARLARVTIEGDGGRSESWMYPIAEDGTVQVGHGMCSGGHGWSGEGPSRARVTLLDDEGREAAPLGSPPLVLRPPAPEPGARTED